MSVLFFTRGQSTVGQSTIFAIALSHDAFLFSIFEDGIKTDVNPRCLDISSATKEAIENRQTLAQQVFSANMNIMRIVNHADHPLVHEIVKLFEQTREKGKCPMYESEKGGIMPGW